MANKRRFYIIFVFRYIIPMFDEMHIIFSKFLQQKNKLVLPIKNGTEG